MSTSCDYYTWDSDSETFVPTHVSIYINILDGLNIKLAGIVEAWAKYQKINTCITVQSKILPIKSRYNVGLPPRIAQNHYIWDSLGESFDNDGF